jgi:LPPG:FO 2-phospho-L-lactate transferase
MTRERAAGPVEDVAFAGVSRAQPVPEALEAIAAARAVVIGPSNPVISIGPILAVPGMREALRASRAPVVAVSPLVRGAVLKGPTDAFMAWAGLELSSDGVAECYAGLLDGLVADEPSGLVRTLVADVRLHDAAARWRVAEATLAFANGGG